MALRRKLVVVADDFGIGPETDRAILELARADLVMSTVLMTNSPHAPAAIAADDDPGAAKVETHYRQSAGQRLQHHVAA